MSKYKQPKTGDGTLWPAGQIQPIASFCTES